MHSIAAGVITEVFGIPVTNTMLAAMLTTITITIIALLIRKNLSEKPGKLQAFFELIYDYIYDLCVSIADNKRAEKFLPWILSFFLFILVSNYWGLIPIFGEGIVVEEYSDEISLTHKVNTEENTVFEVSKDNLELAEGTGTLIIEEAESDEVELSEEHGEVTLLRGATSDPNATFALSAVSFALVIGFGISAHNPIGLLKHYIQYGSLKTMKGIMQIVMFPIFLFVGILEIILEPLKSVSLSFRLFGNIFAGETLVNAMTILNGVAVPFVATPFLLLEILVGVIQALVFSLLTLVFLSIITKQHSAEH
ncbi:F0F1 ATP synthase subunit A [Candidatus Dojkabacteria bacterium]|nr:F0F1 ATP synthase subunit A [Candidatus Dojkabacteria bacterium]